MYGLKLRNAIRLTITNFRHSKRSNRNKFSIVVFWSSFLVVILGFFFGFLYFIHITSDGGNGPDEPLINIFHHFNFLFYTLLLYYGVLYTISGMIHPFISNQETANLISRVPVDSNTLYLSTFFMSVVKAGLLALGYFLIFIPILLLGKFPWYHFILSFLTSWLGIIQIILIMNTVFFLSKPLRRKITSVDFLYDTGNVLVGILQLAPLVLGFLSITEDFFLAFEDYSNFVFIPPLNTSLAFSSLYLRSGIPRVSFLGMGLNVLFIVSLFLLSLKLSENYNVLSEVEITSSKFVTMQSMQRQGMGMKSRDFELLDNISPGSFIHSGGLISLIYKDWLAFRRMKKGDRSLHSLLIIVPLVWILLPRIEEISFILLAFFLIFYLVSELIQITFHIEQDQLSDLINTDKLMKQSKFVEILIINLFALSPLMLFSIPMVVIGSLIISFILAWFHRSKILKSLQGMMLINGLYLILLAPLLF